MVWIRWKLYQETLYFFWKSIPKAFNPNSSFLDYVLYVRWYLRSPGPHAISFLCALVPGMPCVSHASLFTIFRAIHVLCFMWFCATSAQCLTRSRNLGVAQALVFQVPLALYALVPHMLCSSHDLMSFLLSCYSWLLYFWHFILDML